jgi:hypothetical protein
MSDKELLGNTGLRWSAASIRKAESVLEEDNIRRDRDHDDVFFVDSLNSISIYRVQTDGKSWASCSCPNGQRTSRPTCYHLAAALMLLQDTKEK